VSGGALRADDFDEFFVAVYGHSPFGWQRDLAALVTREQRWPDVLDLPTGSGKTAVLDIALFSLALAAYDPPAARRAPLRTVLVVDRRIIVDQAHERAGRLSDELLGHRDREDVLGVVARRLLSLSGNEDGRPLVTGLLRGGIVRDETWARRPDVPALLSATVDQLGSRLLFRGYGVSSGMRPIHAGLLGHDTLIVLDEVHLSQPFAETLRALPRYRGGSDGAAVAGAPDRWSVVEMSATPRPSSSLRIFPKGGLIPGEGDDLLRRRMRASKPVTLEQVAAGGRTDALPATALSHLRRLLTAHEHVRTAAIIVNRVDTARRVASLVKQAMPDAAILLTGRMRAVDRDAVLEEHQGRLLLGRERTSDAPLTVLVATQCVEAGADYDLDALVTECASLDALRQRCGRVDRNGELSAAGTPAPVVVLARAEDLKPGVTDPVYGDALAVTWRWLSEQPDLDVGLTAFPTGAPAETSTRERRAPVLLPAHVRAWVQTAPPPFPDPPVAPWLHGLGGDTDLDLTIVWRADLDEAQLEQDPRGCVNAVDACRPVSSEGLSVPLSAARRWLQGQPPSSVSDVEGAGATAEEITPETSLRRAVRWSSKGSEVIQPRQLRPGDVLVVPTTYGGITSETWDPTATIPVTDIAARATLRQSNRATVRFTAGLWPDGPPVPVPEPDGRVADDQALVRDWLQAAVLTLPEGPDRDVVRALERVRHPRVTRVATDRRTYLVATGRHVGRSADSDTGSDVDSEPETSAFLGRRVELDDHLRGVEALARTLTEHAGLPIELVDDLGLAARLHDLGKADPRFQAWLNDGQPVTAAEVLLAKSGIAPIEVARRRAARRRSGLPNGFRHELLSLAMLESSAPLGSRAHDRDLVLHLVASHHGDCRPFAPVVEDTATTLVRHSVDGTPTEATASHGLARADSGVAERFWDLVERYGPWRLAWLEALLRLADHTCSAREQIDDEEALP